MAEDDRQIRLRLIFDEASALPPDQRAALLDDACRGDDADLRDEIEKLLHDHDELGDFLATSAQSRSAGQQDASIAASAFIGRRIGNFKIRRLIATGGMGSVFEAVQENPRRTVALKVMKTGIVSRSALRRFEYESQILARLRHPGVCQIYEAGVHYETSAQEGGEGLPYFAMEYIPNARPITDHASLKDLPIKDRLEMFVKVCEAVHHGHQKGIIHRDLKPGNILVDTSGQPKVIDFGVARSTDSDMALTTLQTDVGQLIGTLQYMSPEQCDADPHDLDTRSDVYALGVVLYELLCEALPYDVSAVALYQAARVVREASPVRPSTLNRALHGDVETIALKALEKDRQRRYQTAADLGHDIERYLRAEPIEARPTSITYQLRTFARRNKTLCWSLAVIALTLLLGVIGTSIGMIQANEAARSATSRASELQRVSMFWAAMLSQVNSNDAGEYLTADIVARFNQALVDSGTPEEHRLAHAETFHRYWLRVSPTDAASSFIDHVILRPAVEALDREFEDQPLVAARLRQVLADRYRDLALYDAAMDLQQQALATRRRLLGDEHTDTLASINNTGFLYELQGKYDDAEPYHREALVTNRRVLGNDHPQTLTSINNMGSLLLSKGAYSQAEPYLVEAMGTGRRVLGDDDPQTLRSINNMGFLCQARGAFDQAAQYYQEALDTNRRVLGNDHPQTLASINNMALLFKTERKYSQAEPLYQEVLDTSRRVLGNDHPHTLASINNMGVLLKAEGKYELAEPLYQEALEASRRVLGTDHPRTLASINNMGLLLKAEGKYEQAEHYYQEALEVAGRILGDDHPQTIKLISNTGFLLYSQERFNDTEPYFRQAVDRSRHVLGDDHPETATYIYNLAVLLRDLGRTTEAEGYFREAMEKRRRVLGEDDAGTLFAIVGVGQMLLAQDRSKEALELLVPAEQRVRDHDGLKNSRVFALLLASLGRARTNLGEFSSAQASLLEAQSMFASAQSTDQTEAQDCLRALTDLYAAWDAAEPGKGYAAKAAQWKEQMQQVEAGN